MQGQIVYAADLYYGLYIGDFKDLYNKGESEFIYETKIQKQANIWKRTVVFDNYILFSL